MNWVHPYFLGYSIMAGTATAALARHRGRRALLWFIFGTIAWFVAVPWLFSQNLDCPMDRPHHLV